MQKIALLSLFVCGLTLSGCARDSDGPGSAQASGRPADNQTRQANENSGSDAGRTSSGSDATEAREIALTPENTRIAFVGSKPDGTTHDGGFREFSGRLELNPEDDTLQAVAVEIRTESLWADNDRLENHLKSADFFAVRDHPTARFQSTAVEPGESGEYTITGNLTMLGATQEISFPATFQIDGNRPSLKSEFTIDRTRFGMTYGEGQINPDVALSVTVGAESSDDGDSATQDRGSAGDS